MDNYTHVYTIDLLTNDQVMIVFDHGSASDLDIAKASAKRLTGDNAVLYGYSPDDDDPVWHVVPASAIAAVTIRPRPAHVPDPADVLDTYTTPVPDSPGAPVPTS